MFDKLEGAFNEFVEDGFTEIFNKFRKDYIQAVLETKTSEPIILIIELQDGGMSTKVVSLDTTIPELARDYAKRITKDYVPLPVAIMTAGEAWYKTFKNEDEFDGLTENGKPKEGVDEALIISGITCTRKSATNVYSIIRDNNDIRDLVDSGLDNGEPRMLIEFYELLGGEMDKITRRNNGTKTSSKAN